LRTKAVLDGQAETTCGPILSARTDKIAPMKKNNSAKLTVLASKQGTARAPFATRPFRIQVVSIIEDQEISLYDKIVQVPLEVGPCDRKKDDAA
jgi:hypothetical protein